MHVIATAGHVDHGKSALVAALSGINSDRLVEEQEREMTIDLGFAWLTLPNGEELGVIDVPGHRDFIENMLAGISGIDAVLLIIAADEGIMPQTREHLEIINLLGKKNGIVVLTKVDLIKDPEWLDYIETEIHQSLENSVLTDAPIIRISSKTGEGLDLLKKEIEELLIKTQSTSDNGRPRLPIDRVFSLPGFGTIVTGTLQGGSLKIGEQVLIQPVGIPCRIRGLQTHKRKESTANPGSRTAVNLTGVDVDQLSRGDVLTLPSQISPTRRVDAHFQLIASAGTGIKHNDIVKIFIGTAERTARLRLLGIPIVNPGGSGWIQIETDKAFIAEKGDRFIIRRMSPAETLGGGIILDAHPSGRYRLNDPEILLRLESLLRGSPEDLIQNIVMDGEPHQIQDVVRKIGFNDSNGLSIISGLLDQQKILLLQGDNENLQINDIIIAHEEWKKLTRKNENILSQYHDRFPLRTGIPFEEWRSKLGLSGDKLSLFLQKWIESETVVHQTNRIRLATHKIRYTDAQQKKINHLWEIFELDRFNPPSFEKCLELLDEELVNHLLEAGELIRVSTGTVFRTKEYDEMVAFVRKEIEKEGMITVIKFRDHFSTSRKYSLAILEYMDKMGITHREGEGRVFGPDF